MTRLAADIGNDKASQVQWTLALHIMKSTNQHSIPHLFYSLKGNLEGTFANQCTELGVTVENRLLWNADR